VTLLGAQLTASQWIGLVVIVAAVTGLGWHERRTPKPVVAAPLVEPISG
jgi:threonine/homoserine efflux transporter RhtA